MDSSFDQNREEDDEVFALTEVVLATSAGFTDQVEGYQFELEDSEKAYNKVVSDWNMQGTHNGFRTAQGYGTWAVKQ